MVNLNFSIVRLQCVQMQTLDFQSKRLLKEAPIRSEHCGPVWGVRLNCVRRGGLCPLPNFEVWERKIFPEKNYCCFIRKF